MSDLAFVLTILGGVFVVVAGQTALFILFVNVKFEAVDARFTGVDARLGGVDKRLNGIDTRLDGIAARIDDVDGRVGSLERSIHADFIEHLRREHHLGDAV